MKFTLIRLKEIDQPLLKIFLLNFSEGAKTERAQQIQKFTFSDFKLLMEIKEVSSHREFEITSYSSK